MKSIIQTVAVSLLLVASWYFILLIFWSYGANAQERVPIPSQVIINQPQGSPYANYWDNYYPTNGYGYGYGLNRGYTVVTNESLSGNAANAFFGGSTGTASRTTTTIVVPNSYYGYPQYPIWYLLQPTR